MRADWKAIRTVYYWGGLKNARIWSETPLLDTLDFSKTISLYPRNVPCMGLSHLPNLPMCPVIIRINRGYNLYHRMDPVIGFPVKKAEDDSNLSIYSTAARISRNAESDSIWNIEIVYELDDVALQIADRKQFIYMRIIYDFCENKIDIFNWRGKIVNIDNRSDEFERRHVYDVIKIINAIDHSSKHVVEVMQLAADGKPMRARHTTKPWTREDPRNVILIDPSEAKKYGHRIDRCGTHASPIPHTRRGHYATLRADRFGVNKGKRIWRKPAWVGDTEWIFEGRQYKVISPEAMRGGAM